MQRELQRGSDREKGGFVALALAVTRLRVGARAARRPSCELATATILLEALGSIASACYVAVAGRLLRSRVRCSGALNKAPVVVGRHHPFSTIGRKGDVC